MKYRVWALLLALLTLLGATAVAEDTWIVEDAAVPLTIVPDWNEPDTPLLVMARDDGLVHFADIDAPMQEFLNTRARCIFDALRPSQLRQRLAWVTELDLSDYPGTLTDARWLYLFENLTSITLTDASLADLSVIGTFETLTELTLLNCGIFDLSPLAQCKALETVTIGWGDEYLAAAGTFDLTPLQELKKLKTLGLYGGGIRSLDALDSISRRFRTLTISDTAITDFTPLQDFLNLNDLTLDLLQSDVVAEILRTVPRDLKTLALRRIILTADAEEAAGRFRDLTDCILTDCDVESPLFYETLRRASRLTLRSITLPDGGTVGRVYADRTTMELRDVPVSMMAALLQSRSPSLRTLTIDIPALTAELSEALAKKTSINELTVGIGADLDLTDDLWRRISGVRELTIDSKGYILANTDFLGELTRVRTLTLSGVEVADTAGLTALTGLTQLNVYGCRLQDWSFVQSLERLTLVKVYGSALTTNELPYFAVLPALDELRLCGNEITDLTPLLFSQTIRKLDILDNPIADYTVLHDMPAMRTVYLDQGGVITGNYILARSVYIDTVDYQAIYDAAFGKQP